MGLDFHFKICDNSTCRLKRICGVVANMSPCHGEDREFDPRQIRHDGPIAQLVEQGTENPCVTGSIPVRGTNKKSSISRAFLYL